MFPVKTLANWAQSERMDRNGTSANHDAAESFLTKEPEGLRHFQHHGVEEGLDLILSERKNLKIGKCSNVQEDHLPSLGGIRSFN